MKSLFTNRMRRLMFYLIGFALLSFLWALGTAWAYIPPADGQLTFVELIKKEIPKTAEVLNIKRGITPSEHFTALSFGAVLPLFSFVYILYAVKRLQADIILNKEYYFFIQTSHKQSNIVIVNFVAILIGLAVQTTAVILALFVASFIWGYWTFSFNAIISVMLMLFAQNAFSASFVLLGAGITKTGRLHFVFPFLLVFWFILPRAAVLVKEIEFLKYLSPFSAIDIWKTLNKFDPTLPLVFVAAGALLALITALYFNRREFIKAEEDI
ncbi:MAG: hypothetical protein Q4E07_03495 [Eubacteriales bacterium]|nr:hypothetical protein [Eubacteriales bacterium]